MDDDREHDYLAYAGGRIPALRRLAILLCGDDDQADDLVQETITKLYAVWPRAGRIENLDAYTHAMLVRAFLDDRRRGWWKVRLFGAAPESPAPPQANADDRAVVRAALAQVPRRQQAVLVLRFIHDLPIAEVAQILGCSIGTVKSQTSHGLSTLRRILGDRTFTQVGSGGAR
jgi:RNA polymerase sigma-70 factor (sigma-E family)